MTSLITTAATIALSNYSPPTFGNIGKGWKDLWKKKFDFKNQLKTVSKTPFGLTLTTTGTLEPSQITGATNVKYADKSWGEVEGEVDTGTGKTYLKSVFTALNPGSKVTLGGGWDPSSPEPIVRQNLSAKVEVEHTQAFYTAGSVITVGEEPKKDKKDDAALSSTVSVAGTIGWEGLAVGGQVLFRVDKDQNLQDYNVGAQYDHDSFVGAIHTEAQGDVIRASLLHNVSRTHALGVEFISDEFDRLSKPAEPRRKVLNFASEYKVDGNTTVKVRLSNSGEVAAAVEHRLLNPKVAINYSVQSKVKGTSSHKFEKWGLGFTLGEY